MRKRILVITEDLRISGTSEGIVSRSFIARLRNFFPDGIIHIIYIKCFESNDRLDLLPIDNCEEFEINLKPSVFIKWCNRLTRFFLSFSVYEKNLIEQIRKIYKNIKPQNYHHIFFRSTGLEFRSIIALENSKLLPHSIINFHDPFPKAWYRKSDYGFRKSDEKTLRSIIKIVERAKACITPSQVLSQNLAFLYQSNRTFHTIPHQFVPEVFNLPLPNILFSKKRPDKITLSYHGAHMFGRNIDFMLECFDELCAENYEINNTAIMRIRVKGQENSKLRKKYAHNNNIFILDSVDFFTSFSEQMTESDINILMENGPFYSNVLLGKTPIIDYFKKPILIFSPDSSEFRAICGNYTFLCSMNNKVEIKQTINSIVMAVKSGDEISSPFYDLFTQDYFNRSLSKVLV
ncbi:hypothetical protein N9J65_01930 [Flavobacteriaceae bacterium]|nr:hypothetical protein [Flavobacteriaceae bacterium]